MLRSPSDMRDWAKPATSRTACYQENGVVKARCNFRGHAKENVMSFLTFVTANHSHNEGVGGNSMSPTKADASLAIRMKAHGINAIVDDLDLRVTEACCAQGELFPRE